MKILVAEDDPSLQMITEFLMQNWGFEFDIAANGKKAAELAKANEGKYDLCLMDIDMPIMNGYEATKIIRQKTKYLPIIALTANFAFQDKYLDFGMDDFLEKPYDPDILYGKINELTIKYEKVEFKNKKLYIRKEMPVDSEQLKELRELDKKGLALLIIEGGQQKFIVHKNIQNKMSHVLIGEGKELFEFLDRGDSPANCHLYKGNMQTNRLLLTPEQFEERLKVENTGIEKYDSVADQNFSTENKTE